VPDQIDSNSVTFAQKKLSGNLLDDVKPRPNSLTVILFLGSDAPVEIILIARVTPSNLIQPRAKLFVFNCWTHAPCV
jgi:hypothetical protein